MRGDKKKRFTLVTWMDQLGQIDVLQPGEDPGEPVSEVKQGYIYAAERGFLFQPRCCCPDEINIRLFSTISDAKEALSTYCAECVNCLAPDGDSDVLPAGCAYTANSYSLDTIQDAIDQCDEKCGTCRLMNHCDRPPAFTIERGCVAACRYFDFTWHVCSLDRQQPCDLRKMETCQRCERFTLDQLNAMYQAAVEGNDHKVNGKLVKHHFENQPEIEERYEHEPTTPEDIEGGISVFADAEMVTNDCKK